ncbi:hypothetical protein [Lentilactobacillus parabuchneri]|uniref:hypothetical protein n=1 Tax=Lentilactobacillus parabuchneri TaxID=152331 RepID=UPI00178C8613|nr:hypothetical protein [Lentilactobacillus parabuchneri]QOJ85403.1 hypothetical protein ILQ00_01975 [Lentilactobacillus parabuchneri]
MKGGKTMAMNTHFRVRADVVRWIIEHSDFDQLTEEWQLRILRWLEKDVRPSVQQIKQVSDKLGVPFNYFFLSEAPVEDVPLLALRTIRGERKPSRNLTEVLLGMEEQQKELSSQRERQGFGFCRFLGGGVGSHEEPKVIAMKLLERLGLYHDWVFQRDPQQRFVSLQRALTKLRVVVMQSGFVRDDAARQLDPDEFRGFVMLDDFAPLIFVNANVTWSEKLVVLAHETVHAWFETSELFDASDELRQDFRDWEQERQVYNVTRALLLGSYL